MIKRQSPRTTAGGFVCGGCGALTGRLLAAGADRSEARLDALGDCQNAATAATAALMPDLALREILAALETPPEPLEGSTAGRIRSDPQAAIIAELAVREAPEIGVVGSVIRAGEHGDEVEAGRLSILAFLLLHLIGEALPRALGHEGHPRLTSGDEPEDLLGIGDLGPAHVLSIRTG